MDKNLLPDEQIQFRTKKHLIIFLIPVVFAILSVVASYYMQFNSVLVRFIWAPWLVTIILWGHKGLEYMTSEFVITNKRVMMREGFFNRHATELRLNTISQVNVDQNLLGQILNYGNIVINSFGAFDSFSFIAEPFNFQKNINIQLDKKM